MKKILFALCSLISILSCAQGAMDEIWHRFDSINHSTNAAFFRKIISDSNDGCYILAKVNGDIEVLHYNQNNSLVWRANFQSNTLDDDQGEEMILHNNCIYLTGSVHAKGLELDDDLFVACVDTSGSILWERTWNDTADQDEKGLCITGLPNGNVAIGGYAEVVNYREKAIVQVWSATGNLISHTGVPNSYWSNVTDRFDDIAVCNNRIVACGHTMIGATPGNNAIVYCFDLSGTLLWNNTYTSSTNMDETFNALAVYDSLIYVGGTSADGSRMIVRQYTSSGAVNWTRDTVACQHMIEMVTDGNGDVGIVFTDGSICAAKVSRQGVHQWRYNIAPTFTASWWYLTGICVDNANNFYLGATKDDSGSGTDQCIVSLSTSGSVNWIRLRGIATQPGDNDYFNDIFYDNGKVVACGAYFPVSSEQVASVASYDVAGNITDSLTYSYNSARMFTNSLLVLDRNENIYTTIGFEQQEGFYLAKRDSDGNLFWKSTYFDTTSVMVLDMDLDSAGNVYLCGNENLPVSGWDAFLMKFDSNGNFLWKRNYGGAAASSDRGEQVAVDDVGNVYLGVKIGVIVELVKYSTGGGLIWSRAYQGTSTVSWEEVKDIKLDGDSIVFFAYTEYNSTTGRDVALNKVDTAGNLVWHFNWAQSAITTHTDEPSFIDLFSDHSIGIAGRSAASPTGYDILAMRVTQHGTLQWYNIYRGSLTSSYPDEPYDMCIVRDRFYLTGGECTSNASTSITLYTLVLDGAGTTIWDTLLFPEGSSGRSIAVDSTTGIVAVCGGSNYPNEFLTVFFDSTGLVLDTAYFGVALDNGALNVEAMSNGFIVSGYSDYAPMNTSVSHLGAVVKYCIGPAVKLPADTVICSGNSVQLTASSGFSSYQWTPSGSLNNPAIYNPIATPGLTTQYSVTATNSYGCSSGANQQVIVRSTPTVSISPLAPRMCIGDTITLSIPGNLSANWTPNLFLSSDSTASTNVWPASSQLYNVSYTDPWGCAGSDSALVTVNTHPVLVMSSIPDTVCLSGANILLTATPAGGIFSGNGVQTGVLIASLLTTGLDSVVYFYLDTATGCSSTIAEYYIGDSCVVQSVEEASTLIFSAYPIPTNVELHIKFDKPLSGDAVLIMHDCSGQVVLTKTINTNSAQENLDVSSLAHGIYSIQIANENMRGRIIILVQ